MPISKKEVSQNSKAEPLLSSEQKNASGDPASLRAGFFHGGPLHF